MAFSKCPHCKSGSFEIATKEPSGSAYKQIFTQCSGCGAPFGVSDYYNLGLSYKSRRKRLMRWPRGLTGLPLRSRMMTTQRRLPF